MFLLATDGEIPASGGKVSLEGATEATHLIALLLFLLAFGQIRDQVGYQHTDPDRDKKHIVVVYADKIVRDDIYSVWTGGWSPEHRDDF